MKPLMIGILLALASVGSAAAQTTRCGQENNQWVCRVDPELHLPAPAPPNYGANIYQHSMEVGSAAYDQQRRYQLDREAAAAARSSEAERNHASAKVVSDWYVTTGQCNEAASLAYEWGGDLAEQDARARCIPK